VFRHFGGDDDFVGMVEVLRAASRHDGVDRHDSVEELTHAYRHVTNCDLATDVLIAVRNEQIVGYSRVRWWIEEATDDRVFLEIGWTHPDIRGRGVGTAQLAWCERRATDIAAASPHDGTTWIQAFSEGVERDRLELLESSGYTISQRFETLTRNLADPIEDQPLPSGVEIRPVTTAHQRAVWEADQEAFRDHVGFSPATEADFAHFIGWKWHDPALWKVAFAGDQVVGAVLNFVNEDENQEFDRLRGWTEDISTHRAWRGRGVARALITESLRMLRDMGMTEAALGVHVTNPTGAYRLYTGLGYEIVSSEYELRKPLIP
jgi:GNAT superfamily N-acetyltransferase